MSNLVAPPLRGGALGAPFRRALPRLSAAPSRPHVAGHWARLSAAPSRAFPPRRGGATVLFMIFKNSLSKMFEVSLIFIARALLSVINDSFLDILSEVLYKVNQDVRNTVIMRD